MPQEPDIIIIEMSHLNPACIGDHLHQELAAIKENVPPTEPRHMVYFRIGEHWNTVCQWFQDHPYVRWCPVITDSDSIIMVDAKTYPTMRLPRTALPPPGVVRPFTHRAPQRREEEDSEAEFNLTFRLMMGLSP